MRQCIYTLYYGVSAGEYKDGGKILKDASDVRLQTGVIGVLYHLFPRATSQAGMLACTFGDCREVFDLTKYERYSTLC